MMAGTHMLTARKHHAAVPARRGPVAEWSGKGLQNPLQRFNSAPDLVHTPERRRRRLRRALAFAPGTGASWRRLVRARSRPCAWLAMRAGLTSVRSAASPLRRAVALL